jgi:hypothetical protein
LPNDNIDNRRNNSRYRECGTLPFEVTLPQRRKNSRRSQENGRGDDPPAFTVAQEQAARSLTQGKLTFAVRDRTVQPVASEATAPGATATGPLASAGDLDDVGMQGV